MNAAEYHATVNRALQDYELARYIDNTSRMMQELNDASARINAAWITSAPPLPGIKHEGTADRWRPIK